MSENEEGDDSRVTYTNRSKRHNVGRGCPNTRHEKIMALGRAETTERASRDRGRV